MSDPDFSRLLETPMDDIKRPPPMPAGTYNGLISKYTLDKTKSEKRTPYVQFNINLTSPGMDIPSGALEGIDIAKRPQEYSFYLSPDAQWRLKEFLASCGIETAGRSLGACIPEAMGREVLVELVHSPNKKDPNGPPYVNVNNLKGTAGMPA